MVSLEEGGMRAEGLLRRPLPLAAAAPRAPEIKGGSSQAGEAQYPEKQRKGDQEGCISTLSES